MEKRRPVPSQSRRSGPPKVEAAGPALHRAEIAACTVDEAARRSHAQIAVVADREALAVTTEYQGLIGSLSCDTFGDCGIPRYKVVRLDDLAAGIEGLWNNVVYSYSPEKGKR